MPTCVLRYCKSRSGGPEVNWSFFSFPPVGNKTRKVWIQFVQKERRENDWLPSSASKLCSKHFRKIDIKVGKTGRACLVKGSLPCENKDKKPVAVESESDDESDSKSESDDDSDSKPLAADVCDTKPVRDDMSESKPILDDTEDISLKAQVKKLQKEKIRHLDKIKKLDQQNQLLKRKLSKLKNFVINLVKKYDLEITGQMQVAPRKESIP
ncbi:uncharacterized protein [Maniola hyperantus]|uniref:uncharacterized protein n=1 Tax=Aphantopus hyperantus TaxID=2795564 RepID=UPI002145AEFA